MKLRIRSRVKSQLYKLRRGLWFRLANPGPIYIFHHIPKCGGTSLRNALAQWFEIVQDYNEPWSKSYPPAKDLTTLKTNQCLCSHFQRPGNFLTQRYPELLSHPHHFRVFTLIRDPLQTNISMYYYEKKHGRQKDQTLLEVLVRRTNCIAFMTGLSWDNYQSALDRYYFIGVLEEGQHSLDLFADQIGKPRIQFPASNQAERDSQVASLPTELVEKYRHENALDYAIYQYCVDKFRSYSGNALQTQSQL